MSTKYTGGFITKSPVAPTTSAASGIWTLDQQQQAQKAGTWPSPPMFIEDLFSTYVYTGNSSTQTITNGIDLSGQGGLVWIKNRQTSIGVPIGHILTDTQRGVTKFLRSQSTSAQETSASSITAFNSTGFSFGSDTNINYSGDTYASWTFRKQPKFFDIVTWTGTGAATQTISHNLGSAPGCIIAKSTSAVDSWWVYHRASSATPLQSYLRLNLTNAVGTAGSDVWGATSTTITVDANLNQTTNGVTYIAYLFAHDAGGFPVSGGGSTNGISCGSYVGNGMTAGPQVTLGYEPQWVLRKNITAARGGPGTAGSWSLVDNMRGMSQTTCPFLFANESAAEDTSTVTTGYIIPNATGFVDTYTYPDDTYIYIAIRRGPMKVPTTGTSVFAPVQDTSGTPEFISTFPVDASISANAVSGGNKRFQSRLTGTAYLFTNTTAAEATTAGNVWDYQNGWGLNLANDPSWYSWMFRRAPSFFDEVCYTGTGVARTVTHNLAAVPEMMIMKLRDTTQGWQVYHSFIGNTGAMTLNSDSGNINTSSGLWNNTTPTSSVFTVGSNTGTNGSGFNVVAYLFATCAGVSKVGSYTGNGSAQTINCGFTSGARFVLIKRVEVDVSGDWYVWDSARGIVAGNDPHLSLNTTAAEVTTDDSVDTDNTGFIVNQVAATNINVTSATYIFLAIA